MTTAVPPREPWVYAGLIAVVILLGLASRRFAWVLPAFARKSAGDALWALMVFLLAGLFFRRRPPLWNAAVAMIFSTLIEFSQTYHAPWIDGVRARTLGHLVLGSGFAWGDLLAYACGIFVGAAAETARAARRPSLPASPPI